MLNMFMQPLTTLTLPTMPPAPAWTSASSAFRHGRRAAALTQLQTLLETSPAPLRALLQVNLHALDPKTSPPSLTLPEEAPLSLHLLFAEATITASYNAALSARRLPSDAELEVVEKGLRKVWNGNCRKGFVCFLERGLEEGVEKLKGVEKESLGRFSEAAGELYGVCVAGCLEQGEVDKAWDMLRIYKKMRDLCRMLGVGETGEELERVLEGCVMGFRGDMDGGLRVMQGEGVVEGYLSGILMFLRGGMEERVVEKMEGCVGRGYRVSDGLAVLARIKGGLEGWKACLGIGVRRIGGMWEGGRELGKAGNYEGMGGVLECLLEVMEDEDGGGRKEGIVIFEGGKIEKGKVMGALVRAWCGAGKWEKVKEGVAKCVKEGEIEAGVLADGAWAEVAGGDVEEGMRTADTAVEAGMKVSGMMAKAEGFVRLGKLEEAERCLREACKDLVGGEGGVVRGVCFYNLAVVGYCLEKESVDEGFAAAQAAVEKGGGGGGLGVEVAFGRCLVMMAEGKKDEGGDYWVAKRRAMGVEIGDGAEGGGGGGGDGDDGDDAMQVGERFVMSRVPEKVLKRMDRVCWGIVKGAEARRRVEAMMEEVEAGWCKSGGSQVG